MGISLTGMVLVYTYFPHVIITSTLSLLKVAQFRQYVCVCVLSHFSRVQLFATPWTVAHQAPLSMGSSRQEY